MSGSTIGLDSTCLRSNLNEETVRAFREAGIDLPLPRIESLLLRLEMDSAREAMLADRSAQAVALERIADTLDRMLAVMLADEPEETDPGATLDDPSAHLIVAGLRESEDGSMPWDEPDEHQTL